GAEKHRDYSRLQTEIAETRVIVGPSSLRPMKLPLRLFERHVVYRGMPVMHQPVLIELPVLIAVRAVPVARVVVPFVSKPNRDPIPVEGPQLLDEPIVQLSFPFAREEFNDRRTSLDEFGAISPPRVLGVGQSHLLWCAGIPAVFGHPDLLNRRLAREGRERGPFDGSLDSGHEHSFRVSGEAATSEATKMQRVEYVGPAPPFTSIRVAFEPMITTVPLLI